MGIKIEISCAPKLHHETLARRVRQEHPTRIARPAFFFDALGFLLGPWLALMPLAFLSLPLAFVYPSGFFLPAADRPRFFRL